MNGTEQVAHRSRVGQLQAHLEDLALVVEAMDHRTGESHRTLADALALERADRLGETTENRRQGEAQRHRLQMIDREVEHLDDLTAILRRPTLWGRLTWLLTGR